MRTLHETTSRAKNTKTAAPARAVRREATRSKDFEVGVDADFDRDDSNRFNVILSSSVAERLLAVIASQPRSDAGLVVGLERALERMQTMRAQGVW